MEQMQTLGLIALLAGLAKIAILSFSKTENKLNSAFALVCISMILQNAFEFLVAVTYYTNPSLTDQVFKAEMLSLLFLAYCLLLFCLTATESRYAKPIGTVFGFFLMACTGLLLTGHLVTGYKQVGYTLISIPAEYYLALNVYGFTILSAVLVVLTVSTRPDNSEVRNRSRQVRTAVIPICLVGFIVLVLRPFGVNASTAVFMPLATTFFVAMMVLYQSGRIVVFKIKWTVIWKLATSMRDVKLSEWVGLVEELMVKEAMRESGNNQSEAAKLIKSSQTTVGRKFKKYESGEMG